LLVEIYPPSIGAAGLAGALRDLGATATDLRIVVDIDEDAAARLPVLAQEEIFRVAQETARNAVKHSNAKTVTFRLTGGESTTVVFDIDDDGTGFDAVHVAADAKEGHIGLRLLSDAARRCGAELALASRPGRGTRYRMEVPVS
jgi:two-component system NarL family sensor kinase